MEVLYGRCAGLDVHKETVVGCVRLFIEGKVSREVRTFKTTTGDLLALSEWLTGHGCTHVGMEATGVYWKPVWHILSDGEFQLTLANAAHVKNVPGRKSDVSDSVWLSDLLAHGLIRGSFVPDDQTQEMRTMLRTRKQLVRERAGHIQRLQKTLEDANVKLESLVSDIVGVSGRAIIEALIAGWDDPKALAELAHRRLRAKPEDLREALRGRVRKHHRFMLALHLQQIDALNAAITKIDEEVEADLDTFRQAAEILKTIPGIGDIAARTILSEIGRNMERFPTDGHLLSWAGLCPRSDESAGKRRSTRLRKGAPWLKSTLIQCAWAASRTKTGYLPAQYQRLRAKRGAKKAVCAVAASMLTAAYHMLKNGMPYHDLGADHFKARNRTAYARRLVNNLKNLGYGVQLVPVTATAAA